MKNDVLYSVKAQRGPLLRCKGWKQEVLLRMLENNMENAEKAGETGDLRWHRQMRA